MTAPISLQDHPTALRPRRATLGFVLAGAGATLLMAGASAPSPFYPILQQQLHLGPIFIATVFAVYAIVLLAALLTLGSISDHIGRRPVIAVGLVILAVSMVLIWSANSGTSLIISRAVQGLASGILLSALSATVTDFAPRPAAAGILNGIAPMIGLALGAVASGLVINFVGDDMGLVLLPLAVLFVCIAGLIWLVPETSARREGWRRAVRPRVAVPAPARKLFALSVPVVIAGWATGGLFLSLGASIVRNVLHVNDPLLQGLTIAVLPAAGAIAILIVRGKTPRTITIYGASALAVGTLVSLIALGSGSFPVYMIGTIIVGTGFGTAFMGAVGSLVPTTEPHERAELFAALYTTAYLAFGAPTVLAGIAITVFSLQATTIVYGICVAVLALAAVILRLRSRV